MDKEALKKAITSILIGTTISLMTVLFQTLVHWLQANVTTVTGVAFGIWHHLASWKTDQVA